MINLQKTAATVLAAAFSLASVNALADMHGMSGGASAKSMTSAPASSPASAADSAASMTHGEVRKIDKEAKKITLKHGEITNLQMPGMTMVFQVKDAALLDKVKVGDKVKFSADKQGGAIVVTAIEVAP